MSAPPRPWVTFLSGPPRGRLTLLGFPYAGGAGNLFRPWMGKLPPGVDLAVVRLPGREARMAEPPCRSLDDIVAPLARAVALELRPPFVFFGHSMGALVAFEVARRLRAVGAPGPARIVASGHRAPHLPYPRAPIHALPTPRLVEELRRMRGTPEEVLNHPELMELVLPVLRADMEVCETYRHAEGAPLSCPVTVFGGTRDADVPPAALEAWRRHTTGAFRVRLFEGDHFFLHPRQDEVLAALAEELAADAR